MQLRALVAVLGLVVAVGIPPHVQDPVRTEQVQLAPYSSPHSTYLQTADEGLTYAQQLFDHLPAEAPDVTGEVQHWRVGTTHYYLVVAAG